MPNTFCDIHQRPMLKSKFGDNEFWCPDCHKAKKEATPNSQKAINPGGNDDKLMNAITIVNSNLKILISEFRAFSAIFSTTQKEDIDTKDLKF